MKKSVFIAEKPSVAQEFAKALKVICAITVLKIRKTANENPVNSIKKE